MHDASTFGRNQKAAILDRVRGAIAGIRKVMASNIQGLTPAHFLYAVGIFVAGQLIISAAGHIWPTPAPPPPFDQVELTRHLTHIDDNVSDLDRRVCRMENKDKPEAYCP